MEKTLFILVSVVVTSCICYPALDIPVEVKMFTSENFTNIANLLNNDQNTKEVDTKKILDIISMLKKNHKTPVAIILTRTSTEDDTMNGIDNEKNYKDDLNNDNEEEIDSQGLNFTAQSDSVTETMNLNDSETSVDKEVIAENQDFDGLSHHMKDSELDSNIRPDVEGLTEDLNKEENISNEPEVTMTTDTLQESSHDVDIAEDITVNESTKENAFDNRTTDENEEIANFVHDSVESHQQSQEMDNIDANKGVESLDSEIYVDKNSSYSDNDLHNEAYTSESDMVFDSVKNSEITKINSDDNISETRILTSFEESEKAVKDFIKYKCNVRKDNNKYYVLSDSVENTFEHKKDIKKGKRRNKMDAVTYNLSFFFNK